ncbi:MAG: SGNH/GDSL hydrolase family protein [Reyranella sp.]|uniref:SGNH/GDSL hydrolase family protein n=1 Tax=Reyranella sp. TaxID=1929291 RepID=UPI001AC01F96|nr:SGNH/GDSL hydrolase family protein [Reyranella sp.]MBN9089885.1 SGNH/GDSL hydrolase family protein [Reyranella sp.]
MKHWGFAAVVGTVALWTTGAVAEKQCRAAHDLLELGNPLEIAKTAVAEERDLRIVAMGSSSTQGYGATAPQFTYPAQLKMKLEAAMPGIKVHVWNKGVGGQDAAEMVDRMKTDVRPEHAHIVVWQVGTNSAIRRDPLTKFAEKLRAGIDIGHSLGANFVMMNLQYVPAVVALPDEEEYARVMADVAKEKSAGLFRRFEIMRSWYNDGMPYAQFVTNDGLHLNDFGQKCIGRLLSQSILEAINPRRLTGTPRTSQ